MAVSLPPATSSTTPAAATKGSWTRLAAAVAAACAASLTVCATPALALPSGKASVTAAELRNIVEEDFVKRKYLVTGDLTFDVYADDAHFQDSNNDFGRPGVRNWAAGVKTLFVGERSKLALTAPVVLDEAARTITFEGWRQVDVFRLPGAPHTKVFTGHTVLALDPVDNIVVDHVETWDIPPSELLRSFTFFDPNFDPPGFD